MMRTYWTLPSLVAMLLAGALLLTGPLLPAAGDELPSPAPAPGERQLPEAMRSAMAERPRIRVGLKEGDFVGSDQRALQAAVDWVAQLGGGTVEVGEGVYLMRDSLHLRSGVTVRGQGEKTVLRKAPGVVSPLVLDGDYGEEQVTVADGRGFEVGDGVAVWDDDAGGFHTTVARITGKRGNTFSISRPLNADCMVGRKARAATVFPVVSGYDLTEARVEGIAVEGSKGENVHLNGCRGAGIFLYRAHRTVVKGCVVRGYNGDGVSFQQSNDVQVLDCLSEDNASLGLHPGSGSQRPVVRGCTARQNGGDGLFLCWRVRHGLFEENRLLENGGHGISIGHKDSDNLLRANLVQRNGRHGVYFRDESRGMAGHRNRLSGNTIEDNGRKGGGAGIQIDGETEGVVLEANAIREKTGIRIGARAGEVRLDRNRVQAERELEDLRPQAAVAAASAPRAEPLWPEGAPGAVGKEEADRPSLAVYRPSGGPNGAAVVVCPGGGYGFLAVEHEGREVAEWLNSFGVTACVLRYRIAPRYRHPAPLDDARRAVRSVRARAAEWGVDPGRVGILGFSAGGHLAGSASIHWEDGKPDAADPIERVSSRPDFTVLVYPVISFTAPFAHQGSRKNLLGSEPDPALLEKLSLEKQVTAKTPPAFLVHTGGDKGVPPENSVELYLAMRRAGVPAELHLYERGEHGFGLASRDPVLSTWPERCRSWLESRGVLERN